MAKKKTAVKKDVGDVQDHIRARMDASRSTVIKKSEAEYEKSLKQ